MSPAADQTVPIDPQALVSVAIPAYNAAGTIAQTLDSLLDQTYRNLDIVAAPRGAGVWSPRAASPRRAEP